MPKKESINTTYKDKKDQKEQIKKLQEELNVNLDFLDDIN